VVLTDDEWKSVILFLGVAVEKLKVAGLGGWVLAKEIRDKIKNQLEGG
jgi:hypothetical protein